MDDNAITLGEYRMTTTLGVGAFGKVKRAVHIKSGTQVAIKILNRNKIAKQDMKEKVRREIQCLKMFLHPHVVGIYEVISSPTDIFLVMEYVPNGELFEYIVQKGRLTQAEARRLFQQLISGVEYCHRHNVVHRDLKPENLLLDDSNNVKIADFGLSNITQDGWFMHTSCGSPNYAAPEVINGTWYGGPEVDVWSCGVILYALLCGSLPFDDESIPQLFKKIKSGSFKMPALLSEASRDLIAKMLVVDPLSRITIPQIRKHSWFRDSLPPYLSVSNLPSRAEAKQEFDVEVATEVAALGYKKGATVAAVRKAVLNPRWNVVNVAYDLLLDQKRQKLRHAEMEAIRLGVLETTPHEAPLTLLGGGAGGGAGATAAGGAGGSSSGSSSSGSGLVVTPLPAGSPAASGGSTPRPRRRRWRRWYMGIQSKKRPEHVMSEVFRALREADFEWKVLSPYRVRCRWRTNPLVEPPHYIKIQLQLFKFPPHTSSSSGVVQDMYLLDLMRVSGDAFSFMNLCARVIMELKVPSSAKSRSSSTAGASSAPSSYSSSAAVAPPAPSPITSPPVASSSTTPALPVPMAPASSAAAASSASQPMTSTTLSPRLAGTMASPTLPPAHHHGASPRR